MNTMVACDFFCKEVKAITGSYMAYCLVFIHLESRKVWCSPATKHPNDQWVKQQAKNMSMWLNDHNIEMKYLIRDRDTKFTKGFDLIIRTEGTRIVQTPIMAPNANAFIECWIGSLRKECLNHFTCFSTKHFGYIANEYVAYYNDHRPHQSKGNQLLKYHALKTISEINDSIAHRGQTMGFFHLESQKVSANLSIENNTTLSFVQMKAEMLRIESSRNGLPLGQKQSQSIPPNSSAAAPTNVEELK